MPSPNESALAGFSVRAGGKAISATLEIVSLDVWCRTDASRARIAIRVADDPSSGFDIGQSLEIAAGYAGQSAPLFSGAVQSIGLESATDKGLVLIVEAETGGTAPQPATAEPALTLAYGDGVQTMKLRRDGGATAGTVSFQGSPLAVPGGMVALTGLGSGFDGVVALAAVHHAFVDGGWTTCVSIGPDVQTIACDEFIVNAKGNITLSAGANLVLKAHANAQTTALSITQTAQTSFVAESKAQATMTTSGLLTLQGAVVKIN